MKIAFIVYQDFNLGASYVIAYLKSIGHQVRLFLIHAPQSQRRFPLAAINRFSPDLVCFSCVTANHGWALRDAKIITTGKVCSDILFGGVHPTLCPEDFKGYGDVCIGSGEEYFGGKFLPDKLWPDREIFFEQLPPVHRSHQIFMTGFGCPFRCSFCNNHQLHEKLIRRDHLTCIDELLYLKHAQKAKYILFDDDIFTLNRNWLIDFLHYYGQYINLPFTCFGHAKYIDTDIARLLKGYNCQCVWLGVQSGDEDTRKHILNRPETNDQIREACHIIKEAGMKLMIDHIFGIPQDNYVKLLTSYNFYKEIKPDVINCYEMLYLPKARINKYGYSKALHQKQGGWDYQRYANSFSSIPLMVH